MGYYNYYDYYGYFDQFGPYGYGYDAEVARVMLAVLAVIYAAALVFGIGLYVLEASGLYTMAKRRGLRLYGLAWVPLGNLWLMGSIADQYDWVANGKQKNRATTLLVLGIILAVLEIVCACILGVGIAIGLSGDEDLGISILITAAVIAVGLMVLGIVTAVLEYIVLHKIYASSKPDCAVAFTVLGILFSVTIPFFIFVCRKTDYGLTPPAPQMPYSNVYIPPQQ